MISILYREAHVILYACKLLQYASNFTDDNKRQCKLENFCTGDLHSERDVRHDEHWKVLIPRNTKVYYDSLQNHGKCVISMSDSMNCQSHNLWLWLLVGITQCSNQNDKSLANERLYSLSYRYMLYLRLPIERFWSLSFFG